MFSKCFKRNFVPSQKHENRIVSKLITAKLALGKANLSFILFELVDNALKFQNKGSY
jgi:hypothetical protein